MFKQTAQIVTLVTIFYTQTMASNAFNGAWHLRALDGMEVRKARAILDFDMEKMSLSGFDAIIKSFYIITSKMTEIRYQVEKA